MKQTFLFFLSLLVNFYLSAQEPTNPAAKSHYRSVLSSFEKIKLIPLPEQVRKYESELFKTQEKINFIHQYEPTFDVSGLQKTQDELTAKLNQIKADRGAASANAHNVKNELIPLFKVPDVLYQPSTVEEYEKTYANYSKAVKDFIAAEGQKRVTEAKAQNSSLEKDIFEYGNSDYPTIMADLVNKINSASDNTSTHQNYHKLLHYQKYWELASTVFQSSEYQGYLDQTTRALTKLGGMEQILKNKDDNYAEIVRNKRMPAAKISNTDLQKLFESNFMDYCTQFGWDDKIIKINLLTDEWGIIRDPYTKVILKRYQKAAIATLKGGKYVVYDIVNLYQDYNGSEYTKTYCGHDFYGPEEILKENINKP